MKFGDYIRQNREKNGWTQPEAAARAEIEQSYLSKLETSKSYPSEEVFEKLVRLYEIDMSDLGRQVPSEEMDKLKEISKVRSFLLYQQKNETHLLRSWLLAGLLMLMLGGGLFSYEIMQPSHLVEEFRYVSEGILKPDEPNFFFETVGAEGQPHATPDVVKRMVPKSKVLHEDMGERFIELVGENRRVYLARNTNSYSQSSRDKLMMAIGFALMLGSFGCFFIARRWR